VLGYTLFVIVFGAWVRITGSGAGCGQHWPTCHGEIVHRPQSIETVIELTHRVTSGLSLLFAGGLLVWARRRFSPGHPARGASVLAVAFLLVEALLGAGLVAFGLVEDDDSVARAVVMAIHLTNTCILMGALAAAAWTGVDGTDRRPQRPRGSQGWLLGAALLSILLVSMSGAVTALGDTLFPVAADGTMREHIAGDQSVTAHFLQRMRIVHPVLAMGVSLYLLWLAIALPGGMDGDPSVRRLGNLVAGLVLAQLCAGVVNIMLSAPGWMQLVHLALATALWTAMVVFALAGLSREAGGSHHERNT
jgi:cytochrome c oxidase assembly protein subunit 15